MEIDAPIQRVVFSRGVDAWRIPDDGWSVIPARPRGPTPADATLAALGLRPVDAARAASGPTAEEHAREGLEGDVDPVAVAATHGLAPRLLVAAAGTTHLVSAAGALGWRAPLERLFDDPGLGTRAQRLRFLLDAMEHHAARAAESYAAAAAAARRTAALFGTRELTTLAGQTALFVELDALLSAVQRTYLGAGRLLAAAYPERRRTVPGAAVSFDALVLGTRGASADLRETLLAAWDAHGVYAAAYRRALRARDAAALGHAPVRLTRLACGIWTVSVPVPTPGRASEAPRPARGSRAQPQADALDRAWTLATDAMRVVSHVVYAAAQR
ncbi:hypothetical protein J421_1559 [Gemmatirosa kalamazoonensis]|uniref:Uncharacterized protein n=1 Tax=Gemmatirosa kalamazoonensis TaxID=861299 RepID=W0RE57_9BACT|nr:hypothetical protein J421_1559 [Gemmatirosa kalamazoonensis]